MRQFDCFYFLGSGYAYLSVMRIEAMAKQAGVAVRWRPLNVRTVDPMRAICGRPTDRNGSIRASVDVGVDAGPYGDRTDRDHDRRGAHQTGEDRPDQGDDDSAECSQDQSRQCLPLHVRTVRGLVINHRSRAA